MGQSMTKNIMLSEKAIFTYLQIEDEYLFKKELICKENVQINEFGHFLGQIIKTCEMDSNTDLPRYLAEQYQQILDEHRPKLVSNAHRLDEPIRRIRVGRDMEVVRKKVIIL